MNMFSLSQKQKVMVFLVILTLAFVSLALFSSHRLGQMTQQYQTSSDISAGSLSIYHTQSEILLLSRQLSVMSSSSVSSTRQKIQEIVRAVESNASFLRGLGLEQQSNQLSQSAAAFNQAITPWLTLKQELGFNIDEGKLGQLKQLANTIEKKIAETGMVTLNSDFQAMIKSQQNYLLQPSEANKKLFERAMNDFVSMSNVYAMLDIYEAEIESFKQVFTRVSELSSQLSGVEQELFKSEKQMMTFIADITSDLEGISSEYQYLAQQASTETIWSILLACSVIALLTIAIFLLQSRSLSHSIERTQKVLASLSQGDLSNRMSQSNNPNDEFNQLAISINQSCENLGMLVDGVQDSSKALSTNAIELNQGLDSLAHHQSEVGGQTELLASATEEVSVTTGQVSSSLELVAEISRSSTDAAEEGAKVIGAAIGSLEDVSTILTSAAGHIQQLEEASAKVDSVMEIINGIAEQTNLLALNAAIEAARAGEQGRGFAVVADEVRSLAVRTVDAVSEISETIDTMKNESAEVIRYISQSESSMTTGKERGIEAMEALNTIIAKTDEASNQTEMIFSSIKELATTSQSMANNMEQISTAMRELESSNQQLRSVSVVVETRASHLNQECQKFIV